MSLCCIAHHYRSSRSLHLNLITKGATPLCIQARPASHQQCIVVGVESLLCCAVFACVCAVWPPPPPDDFDRPTFPLLPGLSFVVVVVVVGAVSYNNKLLGLSPNKSYNVLELDFLRCSLQRASSSEFIRSAQSMASTPAAVLPDRMDGEV